ncbi:siphovirus ReqiPepy6 Gp37-like family protein [Streptomyces sp. NPDC056638]|uniref:siphovirus ReqiPepy6 Gp37-like family protein n=1 Tax=Streptomyces sp. NPDC056638 TaxID=3345887 RepID=UPI0036B6F718
MGYRVEVFDKNMNRIGEIDEWISLDFSVRLSQEGSWQLLIKDGTPQSKLIEKGGGVAIWQEGVSKPLLSGQVDVFQKYWTTVQHTGPGSLYIGGKCHNTLTYRRLVWPDPARPVSDQWKNLLGYRPLRPTGTGDQIRSEMSYAFGPDALPERRIGNVVFKASATSGDIWDTSRWDVLGTKLEEWMDKRSLAYRCIYNASTQKIDVEIFKPVDRSKEVRFSPELGNLREYIWTLNAPKITRAIVGCAGEGPRRYFLQKIDTATEAEWGMQIEGFVDRRDIGLMVDKTGTLVKATDDMTTDDFNAAKKAADDAATNVLAEGVKSGNFQIYPIDTADCLFGRDYFVGDIVTVAVDGTEYSDVVREVTISVDDGGNAIDVNPKIGEQGSGEPLNLYKTVYDMQKKLRKLESRM